MIKQTAANNAFLATAKRKLSSGLFQLVTQILNSPIQMFVGRPPRAEMEARVERAQVALEQRIGSRLPH